MATEVSDFWNVLNARAGRRPGRLYKSGESAYVDGVAVNPVVDVTAMSARFCLSKPIEDRSADVVNPEGFLLDNYRLNPVVFFDHGFSGHSLPIGRSADENDNLTVTLAPDEVTGVCFFSQNSLEASQIFGLVEEKILRAASVNIVPIDADIRTPDGGGGRPGLLIKSCELIEWSVVGIPDNPEAVRKVLDRNRLADSPISDPIKKSLRAYAARVPKFGRGFDFPVLKDGAMDEDEKQKRRKAAQDAEEEAKRRRKAADDADEEAKRRRKDAGLDDDPVPDAPGGKPDDRDDDGDDITKAAPMGSQVLQATHDNLGEIADSLDSAGDVLEPDSAVKEFTDSLADELRGHMAKCDDLHAQRYGEGITKADEPNENSDGDPLPPDGAAKMRKFLARSKSHRLRLSGVAYDLAQLGTAKNLKPNQRETIRRLAKSLNRISRAAESGAGDGAASDAGRRLEALEKSLDGIAESIQRAVPHRRPY